MEENDNFNLLTRFLKEENIYQIVIHSIKRYCQNRNKNADLCLEICDVSNNGNDMLELFEWIFRIHIHTLIEKKIPTYFRYGDSYHLGEIYNKRWDDFLKKSKTK